MRLLCLSDIHGHAAALAAVLATAERRGYGRVLVAGDHCFPGPEPLATWRRLSQLEALCVQGVGDRAIATVDMDRLRPRDAFEKARLERLREVRAELGGPILRKLAKLPRIARQSLEGGQKLVLVHGSPADPTEPISHDMDDATVAMLLGDEPADLVLCGGSHVPFERSVEREIDGQKTFTQVVNLGSVGEAPGSTEHIDATVDQLEAGVGGLTGRSSPSVGGRTPPGPRYAHATFVESTGGGLEVDQFVVPLGRVA